MVESIYFLKPAWCGDHLAGLRPEQGFQPVTRAVAFRRWFVTLTTNRPDEIEPALASRPGRIDQAIEFPLPDEEGREKLVNLYSRGLEIAEELMQPIVSRTKGVSAAFIRELMRRCAQFQMELSQGSVLGQSAVDAALEEMLITGGVLNRRLLGGEGAGQIIN